MNAMELRMKFRNMATQAKLLMFVLVLFTLRAMAHDASSTVVAAQSAQMQAQHSQASELLRIVRRSTERFQDVSVAEHEGYELQFGCVTGPDSGAMGLHFVNGALVNANVVDPTRPQIVIYEPTANGKLRLIGADFLVFAEAWDAKHVGPPELMGQLFHHFESPNRFGLPAFYTLHVWAWKDNPNGAFVNWHPQVSCENYSGRRPAAGR